MNFAGLIFLLLAHYLTGKGALRLFRLQLEAIPAACFSFLIGVPLLSLVPCIMQLLHIPLTAHSISIGISVYTVLFCIPLLIKMEAPRFPKFTLPAFHELPFLLIILGFIVVSIWRCYYMPPYSRDMLSGPELLAEYAVREKTMVSSVFKIDLSTSNNYFKSPFITSLQIIYKLLVFPFGQIWLSIIFLFFITWLFTLLRARVNHFIAGLLMVLFFMIPEVYAYSFVMLYDYSNMVFFFSGFYFLTQYLRNDRIRYFALSVFLFGLATYIRTESLILIGMMTPLFVVHLYKQKVAIQKIALRFFTFLIVPFAFYFVCINIFVHNFVPLKLNVAGELNNNLGDVSYLFHRLSDMATLLIFSDPGTEFYGYFIFFFISILAIDVIFFRRFSKEALYALYGVAVIYVGLGLIGYLLPLADLSNTTKRGMFKAMPIMLFYMVNSALVQRISDLINGWLHESPKVNTPAPAKVKVQKPAQPQLQAQRKK